MARASTTRREAPRSRQDAGREQDVPGRKPMRARDEVPSLHTGQRAKRVGLLVHARRRSSSEAQARVRRSSPSQGPWSSSSRSRAVPVEVHGWAELRIRFMVKREASSSRPTPSNIRYERRRRGSTSSSSQFRFVVAIGSSSVRSRAGSRSVPSPSRVQAQPNNDRPQTIRYRGAAAAGTARDTRPHSYANTSGLPPHPPANRVAGFEIGYHRTGHHHATEPPASRHTSSP